MSKWTVQDTLNEAQAMLIGLMDEDLTTADIQDIEGITNQIDTVYTRVNNRAQKGA